MATASYALSLKEGEVDIGDYKVQILDPIGSGAFGRVCSGFHRTRHQMIAAKGIDFMNDYMKSAALEEGTLAKTLTHPNLVKIFDINVRKNTVWLFYEFCELGNLAQYLKQHADMNLTDKCFMMHDITQAVQYLHMHKPRIIHRDIKPENVVITKGTRRDLAKLTDFGLAKMYDFGLSEGSSTFYLMQNRTEAGTPIYMAPEFYLKEGTRVNYTATVDIFSLGLLFDVMMEYGPDQRSTIPLSVKAKSEKLPVVFGKEMAENFMKGKSLPKITQIYPTDNKDMILLKTCILRMTTFNSLDRASLDDVLSTLEACCTTFSEDIACCSIANEDIARDPVNTTKWVLVGGIEIGTKFSGYAFSFNLSAKEIQMYNNWGEDIGLQTPSSVLFDQKGRFVDFGHDAENKYAESLENGDRSYRLFRDCGAVLHQPETISSKYEMVSVDGRLKLCALDVFANGLKFLKEHMLDQIAKNQDHLPASSMIGWVVSVPSTCTEEAKQFVQEASFKAGLVRAKRSQTLMIVTQSEANSHFLRNNEGWIDRNDNIGLPPGTKYLIVDAGEETVDITSHQSRSHGGINEVCRKGGAFGEAKVNENFASLIKYALGGQLIEQFRQRYPEDWFQLMTEFKKRIKTATFTGDRKLPVLISSWNMDAVYAETTGGKSVEQAVRKVADECGVGYSSGYLLIKEKAKHKLLKPVVQAIIEQIREVMAKPAIHPFKVVFVVGGFSEYRYLKEMMKMELEPQVQVLIPADLQGTVLKGAVLYGHAQK